MKSSVRMSLNKSNNHDEKNDYANFSNTRIITLFQVPQYEHLQILICNGNSLTTLAGVEHIKHLWKLDVGNNQIRSLQHLSRFIALGSLVLSNNHLQWIELQHIRHMFILDLRLSGNTILDADPNYRQHVLDCLPRIWMCDGIFVTTSERNHVDEFFTQSSLKQKPVRRKLARDMFMPTNLKDRSVNGLFGSRATELFAKFPVNCFINSDLDKKRIKHLASDIQDLLLAEMRNDEKKRYDEFLTENRHILYHMIDIRQNHIEEFNVFLLLLVTDIFYEIPVELLSNVLEVTHTKTIGDLNINAIFSSSEELKCMIASLIYACTCFDRDENHKSAFNDKLDHSLSISITNRIRHLSSPNNYQSYPNTSIVSEAKSMLCLEVMQVLIMCPVFYTLIENPKIQLILKQALDRSPAYESVKDVLQNLNTDQKSAEEQKDLLSPVLGNILKMTVRTLSTKKTKKINETLKETAEDEMNIKTQQQDNNVQHSKPIQKSHQHHHHHRVPTIGDRILTAPQSLGRIKTIPNPDVVLVQFDHILAVNGSMIINGSIHDNTSYISINNFEWDAAHDYWKPKNAHGDKITLHMTTIREETPRSARLIHPPRPLPTRTIEPVERQRPTPKLFEINLSRPKEAFVEPPRPPTPPLVPIQEEIINTEQALVIHNKVNTVEGTVEEREMSIQITKQRKDDSTDDQRPTTPVLIESTLVLVSEQNQTKNASNDQRQPQHSTHDFDYAPSNRRRSTIHRVPVPIHNAAQWFDGPNMQNERSGRMEKVVSSIMRRSFRPIASSTIPRVPILTSPSSKEHAQFRGVRPGTLQDFCIESQKVVPSPFAYRRQSHSPKGRYAQTNRSYGVFHMKSLFNQPCPTPSWI